MNEFPGYEDCPEGIDAIREERIERLMDTVYTARLDETGETQIQPAHEKEDRGASEEGSAETAKEDRG